uniref:Uncharacterized protein n=1 Tax=Peronospora matthiolae TaxID=2874970 RepID=A0AAV1TSA3_9STRA
MYVSFPRFSSSQTFLTPLGAATSEGILSLGSRRGLRSASSKLHSQYQVWTQWTDGSRKRRTGAKSQTDELLGEILRRVGVPHASWLLRWLHSTSMGRASGSRRPANANASASKG